MNLAADQKIQLVLRNPADHDVVETPGAMTANLFEGGAARAPRISSANRTAPGPPVYRAPLPPLLLRHRPRNHRSFCGRQEKPVDLSRPVI